MAGISVAVALNLPSFFQGLSIASPETFQGYINGFADLARGNRFTVFISVPPILQSVYGIINSTYGLAMQCEETELPGRTFGLTEARTYGPSIKIPYQTQFPDLPLTFYCTGNIPGGFDLGLWEKIFFENWLEAINPTYQPGAQSALGGFHNYSYHDDFVTTVDIYHYDSFMNRTYGVRLIDAFPTTLDNIPISWADKGEIMKMNVTMAYTRLLRITQPMNLVYVSQQGSVPVYTQQSQITPIQSIAPQVT